MKRYQLTRKSGDGLLNKHAVDWLDDLGVDPRDIYIGPGGADAIVHKEWAWLPILERDEDGFTVLCTAEGCVGRWSHPLMVWSSFALVGSYPEDFGLTACA